MTKTSQMSACSLHHHPRVSQSPTRTGHQTWAPCTGLSSHNHSPLTTGKETETRRAATGFRGQGWQELESGLRSPGLRHAPVIWHLGLLHTEFHAAPLTHRCKAGLTVISSSLSVQETIFRGSFHCWYYSKSHGNTLH